MKVAKLKAIFSCFVFGTIGLCVKFIPISSSMIALIRSIIGAIVILSFIYFSKQVIDFKAIKQNFKYILGSAIFIVIEWICLFESYKYTTIAISTLCVYMAPIIIVGISSLYLKEKLTRKKAMCIIGALIGMVFVSGALESELTANSIIGISLGLVAAVMYALVVFANKGMHNIKATDKTLAQLVLAIILLIPYILISNTGDVSALNFNASMVLLLLGCFHTGFTYVIYFDALHELPVQSSAIIGYIDPVTAVAISIFILQEPTSVLSIIGAIVVLVSTFISEL